MDRRERYLNDEETLRMFFESMQSSVWTAVPAVVQSFNAQQMTVEAQPGINCQVRDRNGNPQWLPLPMLLDCPVVWQGGGGATATFPIAAGDECLVVLASRCIEGWWANGIPDPKSIPRPPELRMHNLSDGFALCGLRSLPRALPAISTDSVQLRNDDGDVYWDFNPTAKTFKVVAPGGITLNGVTIDSSGNVANATNVNATGNIEASGTVKGDTDVETGSISLKSHVHTGVQTGSGSTGPATG